MERRKIVMGYLQAERLQTFSLYKLFVLGSLFRKHRIPIERNEFTKVKFFQIYEQAINLFAILVNVDKDQ